MIYFILGLFGVIVGSFVSAVTYRIPRGLGFVKGRSFCDSCRLELKWYDNIPLFSYIIYAGESRCCGKNISFRYPIIELVSALGAVALFYLFPISLFTIHYSLFTVSLAILVIDYEHQIIPDELTWLILLLALFPIPYSGAEAHSLFPNLFSGFFFSLLLLTLYLITKGKGMGLGDVKLAIPLGFILGLEKGLTWICVSFILGGIVGSVLLLLKRANLKTKLAFGPFMIIAFWIALLI